MTHLNQLAQQIDADLDKAEIDHLHALVSDWQVLADISMGDAVLWVAGTDGRYLAVAHCRPATGMTIHLDDVVGLYASPMRSATLTQVAKSDTREMYSDLRWVGSYSVIEAICPVTYRGRVIAVMSLEVNSQGLRDDDETSWFNDLAIKICQMVTEGRFPDRSSSVPTASGHGQPRVSDGVIFLDPNGKVLESTPNARSCFRRLGIKGDISGVLLSDQVMRAVKYETTVEETFGVVLKGKASWITEVETRTGIVSLRAIPLWQENRRVGAILLCRDVTEMRRRERELMTKDATIREIHHRVKNNLQTVSALLRMQARRSSSEEVRIALTEAERRVATIARVHEELSQTADELVDFDPMLRRLMRMSAAMATTSQPVKTSFTGSFGVIDSETASVLSVVMSELVTNSVEHGFQDWGGEVAIHAERDGQFFRASVTDNGTGLKRKPGSGLGTNIVRTLMRGELGGQIEWENRPEGGTQVVLQGRIKQEITAEQAQRALERIAAQKNDQLDSQEIEIEF